MSSMDDTQRKELRRLGYELDGVLADVNHSAQGFDAVCMETVKRVRIGLAALAAAKQASALPLPGWQLVPTDPTKAMLRPFYQCPPDELILAWQAALCIAKRLAAAPQEPAEPKDHP
jgi:hypothetical protein